MHYKNTDYRFKSWLRGVTILSVLMFAASGSKADNVTWRVDKAHSRVGFTVKHMGINKVHGVFKRYQATVKADRETGKLSAVNATVDVASIDTETKKRDEHLRAPDLFNVAAFPKMTLKTGAINWQGNSFGGWAKLTIKGKTQSVKYSGKLTGLKQVTEEGRKTLRAGYTVTAKINRKKFGLVFGKMSEGFSMVGETITITLDIETIRD